MKYTSYIILTFVIAINLFFLHKNYIVGNFLEENVSGDAAHYLEIAKNLRSFGVYGDNNSVVPTESATWRPPLSPFLLSVFLFFTENILAIVLFKILFQTILIFTGLYFLYKYTIFPKWVFAIGLLLLIEPYYLKYSYSLLSESVSAALLFLFFCFLLISLIRERHFYSTGFLGFLSIINHPIVVFFILITIFILFVMLFLEDKLSAVLFSLFFSTLILVWPIRNHLVFNEGLYLTASQGTTLAKGWNEKVVLEFTNVDGDLADEGLNLKYLEQGINPANFSVLELSKLYKTATIEFIKSNSLMENVAIAMKKVVSNFNPFPEKPKYGFIEIAGSFFRCLYLLFGIYSIIKLIFSKFQEHFILAIYLAVYLSQMLMSIFIYTGLRFNSAYNLILLVVPLLYVFNLIYPKQKMNLNFLSQS